MNTTTAPTPTDYDVAWGDWLEATFDPDNPPYDRLEDTEI